MTAFGTLAGHEQVNVLLDLLTHRTPAIRAAAVRALARIDADVFLSTLASLDPDEDWTVRTAYAQALGAIPDRRGEPRLRAMLSDEDRACGAGGARGSGGHQRAPAWIAWPSNG